MDGADLLAIIGTALQVIGVGLALRGVPYLRRLLLNGQPGLLRRAWRRVARRSSKVVTGSATLNIGSSTMTALGRVLPPEPPPDAPAPVWQSYYRGVLAVVWKQIDALAGMHDNDLAKLRSEIHEVRTAASEATAEQRRVLAMAVAGEGGKALDQAVIGGWFLIAGLVLLLLSALTA